MDLFEDDLLDEKKKVKKIGTGIIVAAVIVVIAIIGVLVALSYYEARQLGINVNGAAIPFSSTSIITDESGKMYISISDLANKLEYKYYNGEYGTASEDKKKGYVQTNSDEEVASFEMNSKKISKILLNANAKNNDYDYVYIDEPIKYLNGNLYTTIEGIKRIYNVNISHDQETNKINIYTLSYLTQFYTNNIATLGYAQIDDRFYNLKAIINGMLVVKNSSGKYGVISTDTSKSVNEVIGTKYTNLTYIEATNEFLVENNGKVGIVNNQGKQKIALEYDELKLLDNDSGLYIAKLNGKYGVINKQGVIIIHLEYNSIGVDKTLFKSTEISNPYLLYDNCIPVCRDKKWGIYSVTGKLIVPIEYDVMGCVLSTSKGSSANNALLLKDYEGIILGRDMEINDTTKKIYVVVNASGEFLVQLNSRVESIYYITENGQDIYQIEVNGAKGNLDEVFERSGIKKVNRSVDATDDSGNIDINQNIVKDDQNQGKDGNNTTQENQATEQTSNQPTEENNNGSENQGGENQGSEQNSGEGQNPEEGQNPNEGQNPDQQQDQQNPEQ